MYVFARWSPLVFSFLYENFLLAIWWLKKILHIAGRRVGSESGSKKSEYDSEDADPEHLRYGYSSEAIPSVYYWTPTPVERCFGSAWVYYRFPVKFCTQRTGKNCSKNGNFKSGRISLVADPDRGGKFKRDAYLIHRWIEYLNANEIPSSIVTTLAYLRTIGHCFCHEFQEVSGIISNSPRQCCGSASAWIRMILVSWIRIRNPHSKCGFQMRIPDADADPESKIKKLKFLNILSVYFKGTVQREFSSVFDMYG